MKKVDISEATAPLADYAEDPERMPVIVTRQGKPIAAVVALEDVDWESVALSTNREFIALIEESRRRQRLEGGISLDEMRRRLGVTRPEP
jgi:hypothetical protein